MIAGDLEAVPFVVACFGLGMLTIGAIHGAATLLDRALRRREYLPPSWIERRRREVSGGRPPGGGPAAAHDAGERRA